VMLALRDVGRDRAATKRTDWKFGHLAKHG
jgi:hypothetical protein